MNKFEDDLARGCLPTGEPLECLYGMGWWTEMPEEESEPDPAELEAEQARWVMVSERLPKEGGWYIAGLLYSWGSPYSCEVYFDAENIEPRWNNSTSDRIYCWLDGVPEMPKPPEVQE